MQASESRTPGLLRPVFRPLFAASLAEATLNNGTHLPMSAQRGGIPSHTLHGNA
jgi:hypothetical protein